MEVAREAAGDVLEQDPEETLPQNQVVWKQLRMLKKGQVNLSEIS